MGMIVQSNSKGLGAYKTKNTLPLLKAAIVDFKEGKDFASSLFGLASNFNILLFITRQPFAVATAMRATVVDVDIARLIYANAGSSVMKYILFDRQKIRLESNWEIRGTKNGSLQDKMGLRAQHYVVNDLWVDSMFSTKPNFKVRYYVQYLRFSEQNFVGERAQRIL